MLEERPSVCSVYFDTPSRCKIESVSRRMQTTERRSVTTEPIITHCGGAPAGSVCKTVDSWVKHPVYTFYNAYKRFHTDIPKKGVNFGRPSAVALDFGIFC